jgi:AraC-like DNA-binding protein
VDVGELLVGIADYPPGSTFGPRRLADWELVWLTSGSATWSRGPHRLAVAAGQLLLIPPGEPDAFAWDPRRTTRHGYAHFTIAGRPAPGLAVDRPVLRQLTESDPQSALCRYLVALGGSGPEAVRRRSRQVLGLLLDIVVDPAGDPTRAGPLPAPLRAAAEHVGRAWAGHGVGPVRLADLARAAQVSTRTLARLCDAQLGVGPVQAFELIRLARVATLLARSNLTVAAAAHACGYASAFHLSRRFHPRYGMPPAAFHRLAAAGGPLPDPLAEAGLHPLARLVSAAEQAPSV